MIIGIDGSEANESVKVGSSEYAYQLINSLYRISADSDSDLEYKIFIKQNNIGDLPRENRRWKYEVMPSTSFWIIRKLIPRLVFDKKIDVFFSPTHYLPVLTGIPQVCTIHDLGYLMFSEQFRKIDFWQLKYWTAISVIVSKYIIAVSESTKKDIVRHYPFASNKINSVYHGVDHEYFTKNIPQNLVRLVKNKFKIRENYILSMSTLKPSKNIESMIRAFSKLTKKEGGIYENYQLVIAGKKGWLYESIFNLVKDKNLEGKVIFTDYVSNEEKRALYKGARLTLSPSYWEGFGMHVLESMACGTPVVLSKSGSLGEVAGSTGIYVDPTSIDGISEGIDKVVRMNNSEYNKLSELSFKRSNSFTWEKTAQKTLAVLKKATKYADR